MNEECVVEYFTTTNPNERYARVSLLDIARNKFDETPEEKAVIPSIRNCPKIVQYLESENLLMSELKNLLNLKLTKRCGLPFKD